MHLRDPDSVESGAARAPESASARPPVTATGLLPCAIVALSDDPLLLEALSGAAVDGSSVSSSPSADRFVDQLVANGAGIALIDAASVGAPLKNFLTTLREQFPQLLLLLTGPAQLQAQFSAQIADGSIFRFVHKPASSQRLRLFIDAAMRQLAVPAQRSARPMVASRPAAPKPPAGGRRNLVIAGLSAALLIAGILAWAIWQHQSAPPETSPEPVAADQAGASTAAPPAAAQQQEKPGNDSQIVHDGVASDAGTRDNAAREAAALEQAQRSAQGARADQLAVYLQLTRKRLASGALIDPADDSARTYLDSALALAPENPEVRATSLALGEALIAQFRHAVTAGDAVAAQRWLTACSNFHIGSATLNQLTAQLQQLQSAQANQSEPASAPPSSAPLAAPSASGTATASIAPVSTPPAAAAPTNATPVATASATSAPAAAASAVSSAPSVVNESELKRVLFVPPAYPDEANARGIGGWVDLEFTVTTDGKVADISVVASDPANVFDRAARSALARNRYRPVLRDGVPVAQRARMRVRFKQ